MPPKNRTEKAISKKEQDRIIEKQNRRIQIDLRRALLPHTILFFLKIRPHYSFEIRKKIMLYAKTMASIAERNLGMTPFSNRDFTIQQNIIYSNLIKLEDRGILGSYREKSSLGADRKYYYMTAFGERFYNEVIAERLYPRIFMLYCFMDVGLGEHVKKCTFSKSDVKELRKVYTGLGE